MTSSAEQRAAKLRALNRLHTIWVRTILDEDDVGFRPDEHPAHSDYNLHTVDIDADGAAQDELEAAAAQILGGKP